ncbi:hypothetical protein CK203_095960 [Vitis vinifera]|uniref:Uncharacterized protein n=1 Tax=Vitis vinifera TaxID=29760 RepID=A0A438CRS4_VITVI|nr:hypothetical protein CK203_095960 [Vitis vinifera]
MKARKDVRSREGKITSSSNFERELKKLELLKRERKIGYLTGDKVALASEDPLYTTWDAENSMSLMRLEDGLLAEFLILKSAKSLLKFEGRKPPTHNVGKNLIAELLKVLLLVLLKVLPIKQLVFNEPWRRPRVWCDYCNQTAPHSRNLLENPWKTRKLAEQQARREKHRSNPKANATVMNQSHVLSARSRRITF